MLGKRRGSVYYGNSVLDYENKKRAGGTHLYGSGLLCDDDPEESEGADEQ